MKKTCLDFSEELVNESFFNDLIDTQYWGDGFKAEPYFIQLKEEAKRKGIDLVNSDDFDYESYYYGLYKNSEKGLS